MRRLRQHCRDSRRHPRRRAAPRPRSRPETQTYQTAEAYHAVLASAGFTAIDAQIIPRQTPLPTGITGWLKTFRSGFLDTIGVPAADQMRFSAEVEDFLAPMLRDPAGNWIADYVRLRFSAKKPEL